MFSGYYGFLTSQKMRQLNLFKCLEVAEEYNKVERDLKKVFLDDGLFKEPFQEQDEPCFISADEGDNENYVVIWNNLYMLFSINTELNDRIIQIYIKRPEDRWSVPVDENGKFDLMNPNNVKIEVYVDYNVSVVKLNHVLSRCCGDEYRSGAWNKMFYRAINSFVKKVDEYTEITQIKNAYNK